MQTSPAYDRYRKLKSTFISGLCVLSAVLVVAPLGFVFFHLLSEGISSIDLNFLLNLPAPVGEKGGGMANAIVGTLILLGLASAVGIPFGVLGGVYLSEYGNAHFNRVIRFMADILNGVPSIVWGIVVYALIVVPMKGFSALSGGVVLGFMMIPLILRTTEEVLLLVPRDYREAALALGIPKWKTTVFIVMKTAFRGIVSSVLLAQARVAGETAPLLFTAFGNRYWAQSLDQPIAALPLQIFNYAISPYDEWHQQAWAGALVLILMILFINFGIRTIINIGSNK
ncbi:MAG: phosphate ABC transporter permease PstA [Verrucomicrobia bacterium]|nr:phosphate ABC transporter permease PstA [Verrucomicrobiota bacterium]MCF7708380.1 phosphate ABC transporter permease PstA [Verrucomicrobiota bacterium]